jgi:hypothetical protein
MEAEAGRLERLEEDKQAERLRHLAKVSRSYEGGLLHCYDVGDLPRTNNDLEQLFGSHRYHERRAGGREVASPGLVVRGQARLVAGVATRLRVVSGEELAPESLEGWQRQRGALQRRRHGRVCRRRCRRDQQGYLRHLERQFRQSSVLP